MMNSGKRSAICLSLLLFVSTGFATGSAYAKSFIAVSTSDADRSAAWYQRHLDLKLVSSVRRKQPDDPVEVRILDGDIVMVEILQHKDASDALPKGQAHLRHGFFKAGFEVKDIDWWVARWRKEGIKIDYEFCSENIPMTIIKDIDGNSLHVIGAAGTGECVAKS
jgi:catechol 2,3-dioxygenase-like lactoylglutathione lyase family enzyme